jgi:hypothetical protein
MRVTRILAVLAIAATFGFAAGCGGDDDDDDDDAAAETTTTEATTTAPVEDSLQQAVDDAFISCTDAVAAAGVSPLGEAACEEVARSLEREIAGLSASAREDVDAARKQLSAKCRSQVERLDEATQEFGLAACDQLAAGG